MIARAVLGAERGDDASGSANCRDVRRARLIVGGEPARFVVNDDGLAAIADAAAAAERDADVVVLIDPPYTQKADWIRVPDALARASRGPKRACFVVWYPVMSLTRPNAMLARLRAPRFWARSSRSVTTPPRSAAQSPSTGAACCSCVRRRGDRVDCR
jgi:hypothetical protein